MKKILITGGAGFIGSHIARQLVAQGYEVVVLDNLLPQIHGDNPEQTSPLYQSIKGKVSFIRGDVNFREDWLKAIDGVDAIVHLAADTGTGQSMYEIKEYVNTNIGGTALMLDILANTKHHVQRVVAAESRATYGEGKYHCSHCGDVYPLERDEEDMLQGDFACKCPHCGGEVELVPTTEDSAIHPSSVYGITKQVQGQLVHLICQKIGVESVSFRYQNVYGPGQSLTNPYTGILSIFSTRIRNHKDIDIFEDGKESRDFVYIDDVADATILGLTTPEANGKVFNIGTGVATDVMTVARTLCRMYGIEVPLHVSGHFRLGDIRHNLADISLAKKVLHYQPKWTFELGIEAFCRWVGTQRTVQDNYEQSLKEMTRKGFMKGHDISC